ncbi:MAG: BspA family leucine-rich repeat surface protein, partial [Methanobrevibacter sp.]|nr:BspA family leucine-rich repeat surface protein [Methanobrevibacter sp.]
MGQYRQHNDYFEAMTVRPVIDVPKTRIELGETNTFVITYPDGSTEEVEEGSTFTFPNVPSKENEVISTVTFKYNNGEEDTTSDVLREFTPNNWTVNSTNYNPGDTLTVTSNITLQANYVETVVGAIFPSNPTKENNIFQGWYDSETYGSEVSSYNGNEDITLYAHWINGNDGEYNLGVNDIPKESEIVSTVTFKYHNGDPDTTSNVQRSYVPNGWLVDGVHYSNNSAVEKTTSTVIEPDYKEIIHDATFPNNPTKDGYEFVGWFTEETGGEQVTFLNSDSDITIHAQYTDSYALLDTGPNINPIIFNMMSSVSADYKRFVFRKATQTEYESISDSLTNDNIISLSSSPHEVYLWVEQKDDPVSTANYVLLYYSDADIIFMNSDSSSLFENLYSNGKLEIHLSDLNFSKVTNMSKMFMKAGLSILDIDNINTSNVTDMSHMFEQYESYSSTFDLSSLNTSRVTNMSSMFRRNTYLETLDLSNFDTSNVTDMSKMFSTNSLYLKNLDVSNFDTSNVTDMSYMFAYSTYLETLDVSNFDTHNVTNMSNMFASLGKIEELDVSNFDTHNVTDMSNMFANLTIIEELDLSNFDTSNVTNMKEMFYYMT